MIHIKKSGSNVRGVCTRSFFLLILKTQNKLMVGMKNPIKLILRLSFYIMIRLKGLSVIKMSTPIKVTLLNYSLRQ